MSVLNQASDGLYNVLIVLIRAIVRFGPRSRADLIQACGGDVVAVDVGHMNRTLTRWTELGLLSDEGDVIAVAEPYKTELGKTADQAEARLPKIVRTVALQSTNNERFWEAEKSKSADLSRGVAWMLAQDVYTLDTNSSELAKLEGAQIIDSSKQTIGKNDTRWNGLKAWMLYLGFARDGMQWVVDPTEALRDALPQIFTANQELSGPVFVERAASVLPVLDGGAYRVQVEAALNEAAWPKLETGFLSSSLSRAIQRLDREGAINIENRSDSDGIVTLSGSNARAWRDVSHIGSKAVGKVR